MATEIDYSAFTNPQETSLDQEAIDYSAFTDAPVEQPVAESKPIDYGAFTGEPSDAQPIATEEPAPQSGGVGSFVGDVAKGVAIESIGGIGSNIAGAALAAALAPVTGGASLAVYLGVSFAGGVISSIAAQKATGDGNVSTGSALFSGVINSVMPGGGAAKAALSGTRATGAVLRQAAKVEAVRGAAFGVGDATARAVVDEGRMPTMSEVIASGGIGAILGGGIGAVTPLAANSYRKIAGKTVGEIDDAVSKGTVVGEDVINMTTGDGKVPVGTRVRTTAEVNDAGAVNDAANAIESMMTPNALQRPGVLNKVTAEVAPSTSIPKEIADSINDYNNRVKAAEMLGAVIDRRIRDLSKGDSDIEGLLNRYIDTGYVDPSIQRFTPDLNKFREEQRRLSAELSQQIDEGAIARFTDEQRILYSQTVAQSAQDGTYTRRDYRVFTDENFSPDPKLRGPAAREIAASIMAKEGASYGAAFKQAEEHLEKLISRGAKAMKDSGRGRGTGEAASPLKMRTNPGPAERAYLGEITAPGSRIRSTVSGLARLVEQNKTNKVILDELRKYGLVSNVADDTYNARLTLRGEVFDGHYVNDGTLRALNKLFLNPDYNAAESGLIRSVASDILGTFNVGSKATKVILNPPTYAVNFISSIFMIATQGINMVSPKNAARFWQGLQVAASDLKVVEKLKSRTEAERRILLDLKNDMDNHGITNGNVVVEDAKRSAEMGKFASKMFEKVMRPFGAAYASFDTAARYVSWQNNIDMVRRITGITDMSVLKKLSAEITNNQYQNYNMLSEHIRWASSRGVLGPFVAFIAELNRNVFNQVKDARSMINGTYFKNRGIDLNADQLKLLRAEGTKRAASLAAVGFGAAASLVALNRSLGTSEEKEQAMRETLIPDWDKNKSLVLVQSSDGKDLSYTNASYIIPHLSITRAIEAAFLDLDPLGAAELIADDFAGEGTLAARAIFRGIFNQDARGNPISRSDSRLESLAERTGFVVNEALTPGAFREGNRLLKASRGQGNLSVGEVAARQLGYRVNKIDIADTATFTIRNDLENARAFRSTYTRARDYQGVAAGQLATIYQEQNQNYRKSYETMIRHNRNLATLGMDEKARIDVMKRAGLSSSDILNVLDGKVLDMPKEARVTVSSVYDGLPADRPAKIKAINEIARGNPSMGRSLMAMMAREQKDSRTGITSRESLIKNLSPAERAAMIMQSDDPRLTLREWQRKGLASASVTREVQDQLRSQPISR